MKKRIISALAVFLGLALTVSAPFSVSASDGVVPLTSYFSNYQTVSSISDTVEIGENGSFVYFRQFPISSDVSLNNMNDIIFTYEVNVSSKLVTSIGFIPSSTLNVGGVLNFSDGSRLYSWHDRFIVFGDTLPNNNFNVELVFDLSSKQNVTITSFEILCSFSGLAAGYGYQMTFNSVGREVNGIRYTESSIVDSIQSSTDEVTGAVNDAAEDIVSSITDSTSKIIDKLEGPVEGDPAGKVDNLAQDVADGLGNASSELENMNQTMNDSLNVVLGRVDEGQQQDFYTLVLDSLIGDSYIGLIITASSTLTVVIWVLNNLKRTG